jgi:ComF family protein
MYASDGSSQENKACAYTAFKNCLKRALAFKREIPLRIFSGRASLLRMPAHSFTFRKQAFQKKYCTTSLGRLFAQELLLHNTNFKPDGIIPVPLHPRKKRQRGYNQSEAIASGMAEIFGCAMRTDIVIRKIYTQSQTRRNRIDRWENVEQVFGLNPKAKVHSGSYMLVDDVITTGATLEACSQVLVKGKIGEIGIAGLALAKG